MGRRWLQKENKTSNAECCRVYRNKNKKLNGAKDALWKKIARQNVKSKLAKNKLILHIETASKKEESEKNDDPN